MHASGASSSSIYAKQGFHHPNSIADAKQSKNPQDPKGIQNVSASLVYYKEMEIVLAHAASKTRLKLLTSNRNALEAVGTGGIEDSPALFSTALATALLVEVAAATVMAVRKPLSS